MERSTDCVSANYSSYCGLENDKRSPYSYASFASYIIIAILSPVAVVGNALILAALWKKTFQRTPFHLLLSGQALTDLCTGLITQPFLAAFHLLRVTNPHIGILRPVLHKTISIIATVSFVYFGATTLLIITLISVERWLYMSRRSLVTSRRGCVTARAMLLVISISVAVLSALKATNQIKEDPQNIGIVSFTLVCYLITSAAYFKVFRIIRQHQQQVHGSHSSQNVGQPAINLATYKKSVASILHILGLFSFCFLPIAVSLVVMVLLGEVQKVLEAFNISLVSLFLCSSLNPCLYLWRMRDIRAGVRSLLCSNN